MNLEIFATPQLVTCRSSKGSSMQILVSTYTMVKVYIDGLIKRTFHTRLPQSNVDTLLSLTGNPVKHAWWFPPNDRSENNKVP